MTGGHPSCRRVACTSAAATPSPITALMPLSIPSFSFHAGLGVCTLMLLPALVVAQSTTPMAVQASRSNLSAASQAVERGQESLIIPLGELKTLNFPSKITRVALGNGKVVSATAVDNNRLLLIAEQVGSTQMMVWAGASVRTLRVQVIHPQLASTRALLQDIVRGNKGLRLNEFESRLVITGVAHQPVIDQLQKLVTDLPGVLVNVQADQGAVAAPSVLFRLHFIEVKKSLMQKLGVQWSQSMQGPTFAGQAAMRSGMYGSLPPADAGTNLLEPNRPFYSVGGRTRGAFFGIATTLGSNINAYAQNGEVRVLASPELTAKSGGKAKLQVGGEVPIPMAGAFGSTTVEFKPYGILFDIAPSVDADGTITAKLSTELSQIDPTVLVKEIPGFLTRSTSTEVSVRSGETFALSGLLNGELANSIDKVPGLGNIPILGRLFSSDDYRNQRSELVVLVETEIIQKGTGMAEEMLQRGQLNMHEYQELSKQYSEPSGRHPLPRKDVPETLTTEGD